MSVKVSSDLPSLVVASGKASTNREERALNQRRSGRRSLLLSGLLFACGAAASAAGNGSGVSYTAVEDICWNELPDGRATASVHGDMRSGEHLSYVRFPAGYRTLPHTHTHPYVGVVVSGQARHFEPDERQPNAWLGPGSHYRVPGGVVHVSECSSESDCIFAIHQHEAFDRQLVK